MIIELTGIPGSGKSTVLNSLKNDDIVSDIKAYMRFKNILLFDMYLLTNFFKLHPKDFSVLKESFKILKKNNEKIFHKINILRNIYKKLVINRILQNKEEIFLIDEGIVHIPFNLFVNSEDSFSKEEISEFFEILPLPDKILIIDADDETLFQRLIKRGHKRINFDDNDKVKHFIKEARKVLEIIKQKTKASVYFNTGEIDLKTLKKLTGLKNV